MERLAHEAEWCRRYAAINSVSLRKIIKKHGRRCNNRRGYNFLQARRCALRHPARVWRATLADAPCAAPSSAYRIGEMHVSCRPLPVVATLFSAAATARHAHDCSKCGESTA